MGRSKEPAFGNGRGRKARDAAHKDAAPKDAAKAKAPKKGTPAVASDAEVLQEARTIATTIRGLRHREDGLSAELKEVRAKITTQTDHLNELLLDAAKGQTRLNFDAPTAPAKQPPAKPSTTSDDAPWGIQTVLDGVILRVTRAENGDSIAALVDLHPDGDPEPFVIGTYGSVQAAQNALLDEVNHHGDQPEWKPVVATQGELAKAAAKKGVA